MTSKHYPTFKSDIVDNLTSTDTDKPLSANQGRVLNEGKQNKANQYTATLTVAGWSSKTQTVSVTGVTASGTVIVSPAPASFTDYGAAKIYCSAQAAGTLTFACDTVPTTAITVNVVIL